jgi:hypothetical protein
MDTLIFMEPFYLFDKFFKEHNNLVAKHSYQHEHIIKLSKPLYELKQTEH